eukprot:maker-scaffold59_size442576-snap-gene-2.13 protein:Tk11672 transcript:maker-scaffold59_size442576-snap-gene-2.13-mRNA-1 annotation:"hypothetical protein TcasGA2_TC001061"
MLSDEFRKAETTPYYSTFTNNLQQERLAALQPSKDADEPHESWSHNLSEYVSNFYRVILYRVGTACLPCFEIASAFNLFGLFRTKGRAEDDSLLSRSSRSSTSQSIHLMENGDLSGSPSLDQLVAAKEPKKRTRGLKSPTGSLLNIHLGRPSTPVESDARKPKAKGRAKVDLGTKGRVASEVLLRNNPGLVGKLDENNKPFVKEPRSHSLTNTNRIKLKNDIASEMSSKSGSPSPVITRDFRESSVNSRSSLETNDGEIRDERYPSPFNKSGSLSSLGSRSESMMSVYSQEGGRYGSVVVRGDVEFGMLYSFSSGCLEMAIKQCRDLASVDTKRNRSDPYVKVYLLPDKTKGGKRKTKVKKHTLNPVFDEILKFQMPLSEVERRTMWLTVWHSDMFGRNDFLGEVMMPMAGQALDDPSPKWYSLQDRTEAPGGEDEAGAYRGEIIVALKFVPLPSDLKSKSSRHARKTRGKLMVLIKEAKNLVPLKGSTNIDPFCKCYLLPERNKSGKQKTSVCRRSLNPRWEHTVTWDQVSLAELADRSLEVSIWDHDRLGQNEMLGGVRFNLGSGKHQSKPSTWMDSAGKEVTLWQQMLDRTNFWVEGAVNLRPGTIDTDSVIGISDDPVLKLRYPRVDSGSIAVPTANAPTNHTGQLVAAIAAFDGQRSPTVALTRVFPAIGRSSTDKDARDPLVLPGPPVEVHAFGVGDDGQVDLAEDGRDVAVLGASAPARYCGRASNQVLVGIRQADGDDVGLELHAVDHLEESNVVLVAELVKVHVGNHASDASIEMPVGLAAIQDVVLADADQEIAGRDVLDAMGCGDHPCVGEQGRAAFVAELAVLVLSQRHLPRPFAVTGHATAHDAPLPDETSAADVLVVRSGIEGVELLLSIAPSIVGEAIGGLGVDCHILVVLAEKLRGELAAVCDPCPAIGTHLDAALVLVILGHAALQPIVGGELAAIVIPSELAHLFKVTGTHPVPACAIGALQNRDQSVAVLFGGNLGQMTQTADALVLGLRPGQVV